MSACVTPRPALLPLSIETKSVHRGRLLVVGACDRTLQIRHTGEHWDDGYEIPYPAIYALGKTLRRRQDLVAKRQRKAASKKAGRRAAQKASCWALSLLTTLSGWLYYHVVSQLTTRPTPTSEKTLDSKVSVVEDFSSDVVGGLRGLGCVKRDAVEAVRRVVERGVGVGEFEGLFRAALREVRP